MSGSAAAQAAPWSAAALLEALEARGDETAVAIVEGDALHETSAAALAGRAVAMAGALEAAGVRPGDAAAVHAANGAHWIAAGLACGRIGAALEPLDAASPQDEAHAVAAALGARVFLCDEREPGEGAPPALTLSRLGAAGRQPASSPFRPSRDAPAVLARTSGTTGRPKTIRVSAGAVGFNVRALAESGLVRRGDRVLMPLPMHHVFPWIVGVLAPLEVGASLILPEGVSGPQIATALRRGRPTIAVGTPRLWEAMAAAVRARLGVAGGAALEGLRRLPPSLRHSLGRLLFAPVRRSAAPALRLLVSGGARLEPGARETLEMLGWDVRCGYGLAETAALFTGELHAKRPGTEGRPLPGGELRIGDPGADGTGEILVRGPSVFSGYLDDAEATARAFDADGFFRTGDLGRLDPDGFLIVTGRVREIIVLSGGENIVPEELERIYGAADDIADIAVLECDGALHALVVPEMAAIRARGTVDAASAVRVALDLTARDLPSTRRLSGFRLTAVPLPRTRLGKLRRFLLPALYDAAGEARAEPKPLSPEERAWVRHPSCAAAWRAVEKAAGSRRVGLDSHLGFDLGLDSFAWLTLALDIEGETGVRLGAEDIAGMSTVRDLLRTVEAHAARAPADRVGGIPSRLAEARERWLSPRSRAERAAGRLVLSTVSGLMRLVYHLRTEGAEALPREGAVLICANHVSDLDPAALAAALPSALRDRAAWAGDRARIFDHPLRRRLCRPLRILPADETAPDVVVALAAEVLSGGGAMVWFPEGWRSPDGRLLPFRPGVGRVIAAAHPPVVPAFIDGAREIWPRDRIRPRLSGRLRVVFGPPVAPETLVPGGELASRAPEEIAEALRRAVAELARSAGAEIL